MGPGFTGKVAIVTGASGGLGQELARQMSKTAMSESKLEPPAFEISPAIW